MSAMRKNKPGRQTPRSDGCPPARKPGRPRGSIKKLSSEDRALLLTAIEAGGTDYAVAKSVRVDPRTFKRWRAIAEGPDEHPEKLYLIELFAEIDAANGRARIRREIEVAAKQPLPWLKANAPSRPGLPGWTPPVPEDPEANEAPLYVPSAEELLETVQILIASGAIPDPTKPDPVKEEDDVSD